MILKLLILSIFLLALAALGFGIRMLIRNTASFPETHVSNNPEMQKRGITCAQDTDTGCNVGGGGCSTCGKLF